jgi:hypothetical protein
MSIRAPERNLSARCANLRIVGRESNVERSPGNVGMTPGHGMKGPIKIPRMAKEEYDSLIRRQHVI